MYRVMCTACGSKVVELNYLLARSQAECHAKEASHWGKVLFWKIGRPGGSAGPVRVVREWGTCTLEWEKKSA